MILTVFGDGDRVGLDLIARTVYTLLPEEYVIKEDDQSDGIFVIDINTLRRFDPIVKANVSADRIRAEVSLYPGINSPKVLSDEDILEILKERYNFDPLYIKKPLLTELSGHYRRGFVVEAIPAVEGLPVVNGKDAVLQTYFEQPSQRPKLLVNGKVDYKSFTNFIMIKENDLLVKRTPPTEGTRGFDVTGAEIFPVKGIDKTVEILDGVSVNEERTEYRAKCSGHVVYAKNILSVLPLLNINGNVDYRTGNINFDGTVLVSKDVQTGLSVAADDIIIEGIDEDATLTARNVINIKTGIKGIGNKGYVKAGTDVVAGYSENSRISAKGTIEIKKYCFNSILAAEKIFTSSKDAIITGGIIRAFSLIQINNVGSKGTNDMLLAIGISPEMEERAYNIKAELTQLSETLKKIMDVLSQVDLTNPAIVKNAKVRKLLETASLLKRKQPLLEAKLADVTSKSIHPDPRIIIEGTIRAGVKIKFFDVQIELKTDMTKVEFYFDNKGREISFQTYIPKA